MNSFFIGLLAAAAFVASASSAQFDPPSGVIDPPPGPQDYIAALPLRNWVFGKLLWQGREPCTEDFCERLTTGIRFFYSSKRKRPAAAVTAIL